MSKPTNIVQFGFSAGEMGLGAIRDIPEERVTAVLGIPAAVVGFGTGLQTAKVGATMSELRDQAYENCIIPTQRLVADELSVQMLPDFATPAELARLEVAFDLSKVRVRRKHRASSPTVSRPLPARESRSAPKRAPRWACLCGPGTTCSSPRPAS